MKILTDINTKITNISNLSLTYTNCITYDKILAEIKLLNSTIHYNRVFYINNLEVLYGKKSRKQTKPILQS